MTARVMNLWTKLFSLKCEDRDSFNAFYSQVKGITHKLTEHSSVAVQDDTFMPAFLGGRAQQENYCATVATNNGYIYGIPCDARRVIKFDPDSKSLISDLTLVVEIASRKRSRD